MSKIIPNFGTVPSGGKKLTDFSSKKLASSVGVVHVDEEIEEVLEPQKSTSANPAALKVRVKNSLLVQSGKKGNDVDLELSKNPSKKEIEEKIAELSKLIGLKEKAQLAEEKSQKKEEVEKKAPKPAYMLSTEQINKIAEEKMAAALATQSSKGIEKNADEREKYAQFIKNYQKRDGKEQQNDSASRSEIENKLNQLRQMNTTIVDVQKDEIDKIKSGLSTPTSLQKMKKSGSILSETSEESEKKFEEALKESQQKKKLQPSLQTLRKASLHFPTENIYEDDKKGESKKESGVKEKELSLSKPLQPNIALPSQSKIALSQNEAVTKEQPKPVDNNQSFSNNQTNQKPQASTTWQPKPLTKDIVQQAQLHHLQTIRQIPAPQLPLSHIQSIKPATDTTSKVYQNITFKVPKKGKIPQDLLALSQANVGRQNRPVIAQIKQDTQNTQNQNNALMQENTQKGSIDTQPKKELEPQLNQKIQPRTTPNLGAEIQKQYKKRKKSGFLVKALISVSILSLFSGVFGVTSGIISVDKVTQAVAGVYDSKDQNIPLTEFEQWTKDKTGSVQKAETDFDDDGLTNYEEYLLKTNPASKNTCDNNKTDLENLVNFVDPATCEKMDVKNDSETSTFNQIISKSEIRTKLLALESGTDGSESSEPKQVVGVLETFGVSDWSDLNSINQSQISSEAELNSKKQEYLRLIQKIDNYITKYRSYDVYDRDYETPVHPAVYLQTSVQYDVNLKYVLAVGRLESRFGTDRYTNSGAETRIGANQNVYSIGLDDSGSDNRFPTWEQGVTAFGRWYKRFNDQGINDCRKWRIYNPNGDYCTKVEAYASEIDAYLKE